MAKVQIRVWLRYKQGCAILGGKKLGRRLLHNGWNPQKYRASESVVSPIYTPPRPTNFITFNSMTMIPIS